MKVTDYKKIKSTFIKTNARQQAGLACLASVIKVHGGNAGLDKLLKNSGASVNSVSLLGLCKAARTEGFEANGYKADIEFLKEQENPVILHIEKDAGYDDFVVVYGWQNNKFIIGDPHWGIIEYREEELEAVWKSKALMLLEPGKSPKENDDRKDMKKRWIQRIYKNQKKSLIINGFTSVLSAIAILFLLLIFFKTGGQFSTAIEIRQKVIITVAAFLIFLSFIAIILVKNGIAAYGIKNLINEFNSQIVNGIFSKYRDSERQSAGIINSLSKVALEYSEVITKMVSGMPFYGIISIAALGYISKHSIWAGLSLFTTFILLTSVILFYRKRISRIIVMNYNAEIQRTDNLVHHNNLSKYIQLTNSESTFKSATGKILNFSSETGQRLKQGENRLVLLFVIISSITVLIISIFALTGVIKVATNSYNFIGWLVVYLAGSNLLAALGAKYLVLNSSFDFIYIFLGEELAESEEELIDSSNTQVQQLSRIRANKLSFAYPGKLPVFQDLSFVAEKGKITVIYGNSGSGKSTLASLLNRLLPLDKSDIRIDDANWQSFNDFQWREYSSTVLQPVQLFNSTVIENIGWGNKSLSQEKIVTFCEHSGFDSFFTKLTDGYATFPNKLSEGQKSMVSFAAALYRNPEVLLLDEPFANMDEEMRVFCWQLLHQLKAEMVILILTGNKEWANMADSLVSLN
ncbi:MAG: cysteine peptidase family C39 domain-containing protein [Draconibacterium sp.]